MNPSLELREEAAKLHEEMTKFEDFLMTAQDNGASDDQLLILKAQGEQAWLYKMFCLQHGFALMTDASGLFLRCAETQIPLVDSDEVIETETGQLLRVKQAA